MQVEALVLAALNRGLVLAVLELLALASEVLEALAPALALVAALRREEAGLASLVRAQLLAMLSRRTLREARFISRRMELLRSLDILCRLRWRMAPLLLLLSALCMVVAEQVVEALEQAGLAVEALALAELAVTQP